MFVSLVCHREDPVRGLANMGRLRRVFNQHLLDRTANVSACLRASVSPSSRPDVIGGKAWAFQQAMDAVWYYADSHPAFSQVCRRTLARITADPM